jgi:hypothetical protein
MSGRTPQNVSQRIAEAAVMTFLARGHRLGIQHLASIPVAERDGLLNRSPLRRAG